MSAPVTAMTDSAAFDTKLFRRCVGQFATGVTVITAQIGDERVGVTANSFSSLSLDPPLVLWSIARSSRSFAAFQKAAHFAINVLSTDQLALSQGFSSSATDKFAGVRWQPGSTGAPVLDGVVARIECRVHAKIDGGDHVIIVGHVEGFERFDGDPLLFVQGRYGIAIDHPSARVSGPGAAVPIPLRAQADGSQLFFRLLYQAFYAMSETFDEHRRAENMNLVSLRVLVGAYETPGITLESLARIMHIARPDANDAADELIERGDLLRDAEGKLSLTAQGRQRREAIAQRELEFERRQMAALPEAEVACARRLLTRLIELNGGR